MKDEDVKNRLESAIKILSDKDLDLFETNVNERSITHKLAEYLQGLFPCYNVDCEYNRHGNKIKESDWPKEIEEIIKKGKKNNCDLTDTNAKTVFPDIIVHKRRTDGKNLLVIEVKKSTSSTKDSGRDECKLKAFTREKESNDKNSFEYKLGAFIEFDMDNRKVREKKFFKNGRKLNNGTKK